MKSNTKQAIIFGMIAGSLLLISIGIYTTISPSIIYGNINEQINYTYNPNTHEMLLYSDTEFLINEVIYMGNTEMGWDSNTNYTSNYTTKFDVTTKKLKITTGTTYIIYNITYNNNKFIIQGE